EPAPDDPGEGRRPSAVVRRFDRAHYGALTMKARLLAAAAVTALCLARAGSVLAAPTMADLAQANDHAALKMVSRATANQASADGTPALMWAVHNDNVALVHALIAAG